MKKGKIINEVANQEWFKNLSPIYKFIIGVICLGITFLSGFSFDKIAKTKTDTQEVKTEKVDKII